jgi:hypothetical protein
LQTCSIQLFQLRLSPEQSGKVEYVRERLLGIANNELIHSRIYLWSRHIECIVAKANKTLGLVIEVMFNKRVGVFYHNIKHDA